MIETLPQFPAEENEKTERLRLLRETAYKYGIAMVLLVLNNVAAPILFSFLFSLLGIRVTKDTDGYYAAVMVLNELSAYVLPILLLRAMFARERALFSPDRSYVRFSGDSLALFLGGVAAGSLGTMLTELIGGLLDRLFGTGEIPEAFGSMKPQTPVQFGVFAFCICVVAPICEEYLFRDLLLKPLRRFHDLAAVLFSGLTFGLYHGNFDQFAYAALLGGFYSIAAVRANSIRPTVLLHAANNLIVSLATYLPAAVPEAKEFSAVFSAVLNLMFPMGVIAILLAAGRGCFKLNSHEPTLTGGEIMKKLILSPGILVGIAVMLGSFFFF